MVGYNHHRDFNAWIIGILVFILAMTITFSKVYGLEYFNNPGPGDISSESNGTTAYVTIKQWENVPNTSQDDYFSPTFPTATPSSIPEPASLTLLILGCGIFLASRRK